MGDNNNKIIYSFFWLATEKTKMKRLEATELKSVDPDGDQLIFWKIMLGEEPRMELTFRITPFLRFEAWDELLNDISKMEKKDIIQCLESNLKGEALEKRWSLIPEIFGINGCYDLQERKSAVRFSLLGDCGEEIFESILLVILETLFAQCYDHKNSISVKGIMDTFISELAAEYPLSEQLNGCILSRYETIIDRLNKCFPDKSFYGKGYERLQSDWIDAVEQAQDCKDVIDYYEKMYPNNRSLFYLLYLIQEICKMTGCPCDLPTEFSQENLVNKVGLMPKPIQDMRTLYEEISHMNDVTKQKEIADEIIDHIHNRYVNWDRLVIDKLIEKAKA